jgi:hypothetical protein
VYQVWLKSLQAFQSYARTYTQSNKHTYKHTSIFIDIHKILTHKYSNMCTKFGWNRSRRSRVMLEHIHIHTHTHPFLYICIDYLRSVWWLVINEQENYLCLSRGSLQNFTWTEEKRGKHPSMKTFHALSRRIFKPRTSRMLIEFGVLKAVILNVAIFWWCSTL